MQRDFFMILKSLLKRLLIISSLSITAFGIGLNAYSRDLSPLSGAIGASSIADHCSLDILTYVTFYTSSFSNDSLAHFDEQTLREFFHGRGLNLRGRIFGSAFLFNKSELQLNVRLRERRKSLEFFFYEDENSVLLSSAYLRDDDLRSLNCPDHLIQEANQLVTETIEVLSSLDDGQRQGWSDFCSNYLDYEARASDAMENDWKLDGGLTYRGCAPSLGWKKRAFESFCLGQERTAFTLFQRQEDRESLGLPDLLQFVFDGYGEFNAAYAVELGAVNLRGDELGEPFIRRKTADALKLFERTLLEAKDHNEDLRSTSIQLHYYDGSGLDLSVNEKSALACYEDMREWFGQLEPLIDDYVKPRISLLGFSNGGAAALRFQKKLGELGDFIDLLITIDPIPRAIGYVMRNVFPTDWLSSRHEKTGRHVNIYQEIDYGTSYPLLLRSSSLPAADENVLITNEDWGGDDGYRAHNYIIQSTEYVDEKVSCELKSVFLGRAPTCLNVSY